MNNNVMNKEAVQLLNAVSSDSDSASDLQFTLAPPPAVQIRKKIRTKRKQQKRDGPASPAAPTCSLVSVLKVAGLSFAIGGTLILGWMVMLLHSEVQELSEKLAKVPTSYDDDTILELKKSVKELSTNQTYYYNLVQNYSRSVDDIRVHLSAVTADVAGIKESLKEAPHMMNIGKELDSLKSSLATYGASISDLKLGLNDYTAHFADTISSLNSTVLAKLNFVIEDLHHHHEIITALQNTTDRLSSFQMPSDIVRRIDALQTALAKVETEHLNKTTTSSG